MTAAAIEDLENGEDSRARLEAGDLVLANNIWWGFGSGNTLEAIAPDDWTREHLVANGNEVVDPQLTGISRTNDGGLDPRPMSGSPALSRRRVRMTVSSRQSAIAGPSMPTISGWPAGPFSTTSESSFRA